MPRMHHHVNVDELQTLWHAGWTAKAIGQRYRIAESTVYWIRQRYKLRNRRTQAEIREALEAPSPEDDAASADSLRFSPWVAARIKELGLGVHA